VALVFAWLNFFIHPTNNYYVKITIAPKGRGSYAAARKLEEGDGGRGRLCKKELETVNDLVGFVIKIDDEAQGQGDRNGKE